MKKVITLILSLLMTFACVSCGTNKNKKDDDSSVFNKPGKNKTEITVKNFGGGIGHVWLDEAAERFAELNAETSYAEGKKGVYISINNTFNEETDNMAGQTTHMFFDERHSDVHQFSLKEKGKPMCLDSIVLDESREGGALSDKIFDSVKGSLQDNDGHYYGLPHYEYYGGLTYNREIFDKYFAYFAYDSDNGESFPSQYGNAIFVNDLQSKKSFGPDGIENTDDDGLPRTLEEFVILCDYIKFASADKVAPVTISGQYNKYFDYLYTGIWSAIAGAEQMKNYYNCEGEIEVVKRDASGNFMFTNENLFQSIDYIKKPVTEKITLNGSNGYMGNDMVGKYYAYSIVKILKTEGFLSDNSSGTTSHYDAQMDLFMNDVGTTNESAMLIEGSYWFNESEEQGSFDKMKKYCKKDSQDLDVRWMSLPTALNNADFVAGREECFLDIGQCYAMINGRYENDAEMKTACLEFMKFLYSEQELKNFTICTGMPRAIDYTLSETEKTEFSKFYQNMWNRRIANTNNLVYYSGTTDAFLKNRSALNIMLDSKLFMSVEQKSWALMDTKTVAQIFKETSKTSTGWVI